MKSCEVVVFLNPEAMLKEKKRLGFSNATTPPCFLGKTSALKLFTNADHNEIFAPKFHRNIRFSSNEITSSLCTIQSILKQNFIDTLPQILIKIQIRLNGSAPFYRQCYLLLLTISGKINFKTFI